MTPLCEIAQKHGTDKFPYYTPFYDLLLFYRRESVKSVLEIGIGTPHTMKHVPDYKPGASLRMWREYFPQAEIFGIDVNYDAIYLARDERITTLLADQSKQSELTRVGTITGILDLIIDDGSHDPVHQSVTLDTLWSSLAPGGLYIIEDCKFPHMVHALDSRDHAEIAINSKDKPTAYCVVLRKN